MDEAAVRALWEKVPSVNCKGLCTECCGPIAMSPAEQAVLDAKNITVGFDRETLTCDKLNPFGKCSIYNDRPLVCRLWGAVPDMPCAWGCEPTLTSAEGRQLMQAMLTGDPS